MLLTRFPLLASPPGRTNRSLHRGGTLFFHEFPDFPSAELSKGHHHGLLLLAWLELSALPQVHGAYGNAREDGQLFLGEA